MSTSSQAAQDLLRQNKPEEALALIEPAAKAERASHGDLHAYAQALKALMRREEASRSMPRRGRKPRHAVAEHNLASTRRPRRVDRGRDRLPARPAEGATRRRPGRFWAGLDDLKRMDEAEAALKQAISRRPTFGDAPRPRQLVWMRSGDATPRWPPWPRRRPPIRNLPSSPSNTPGRSTTPAARSSPSRCSPTPSHARRRPTTCSRSSPRVSP